MKALIIGATGATGKDLLLQLLEDDAYREIHSFVRKDNGFRHPKLRTHLVDFDRIEQWAELVCGEVAFCCLGTTLAVAGSKEAQWRVDYDYQYAFAQQCYKNGIGRFVLVSAAGAKAESKLFYNRMKGALEEAVKGLGFECLLIFQPSILIRPKSNRRGENITVKVISFLNKLGILRRYKPMPTAILAERMRKEAATAPNGIHTLTLDEIFLK